MFSRIWSWILALLISIFPSLVRYSPTLDWEAAAAVVLTAIQERDIDAIEAFMCKNIKDNVPNLHMEIGIFIDSIQGKITKYTKSASNGSGFNGSSGGKTIEQKDSAWDMETTEGTYHMSITWEIYNNFAFEERGIRSIGLTAKTDNGYESLALIRATKGIWNMHD
jgi:hypothetical protein